MAPNTGTYWHTGTPTQTKISNTRNANKNTKKHGSTMYASSAQHSVIRHHDSKEKGRQDVKLWGPLQLLMEPHLTATRCHLYGIMQCYLQSDTTQHTRLKLRPAREGWNLIYLPTQKRWKAKLTLRIYLSSFFLAGCNDMKNDLSSHNLSVEHRAGTGQAIPAAKQWNSASWTMMMTITTQ